MDTLDFLRKEEHISTNGFSSKAQFLKDHWGWLKYSYAIAIKTRHRMKELSVTQKELAAKLGCSQQHISVLLAGKSNMTLETISKIEQALTFDLIGGSLDDFNYPIPEQVPKYLSDSGMSKDTPQGTGTNKLVDGYIPRKKKGPKKPETK